MGNTDRHHENWGVLLKLREEDFDLQIAPTYDHASSLGRELSDERKERALDESRVGRYSERGRGAVYWSEADRHPPSPLQLIRWAAPEYPTLFLSVLRRLESLELQELATMVNRIPPDWMPEASRKFAIALMCYNCVQLQTLLQGIS